MRKVLFGLLLLGLVGLVMLRGRDELPWRELSPTVIFRGPTMGTSYTIRIGARPARESVDELQRLVEARLDEINAEMSTYASDSELSRFNRSSSGDWFDVSADTAEVVAASLVVSERSQGAFDVTVGPLVNLWSFGPDRRPRGVPSEADITAALKRVGYHQLEVRQTPPALRKRHADVYVDLSAIAKGFAVDAIAGLLESRRIASYMVEIGGEVRTQGRKPDGTRWRIGIERPVLDERAIQCVLELEDRSLATSGDYRNFFQWEGRLYSHEIDPRTGRPVHHGVASVTVLGDSTMDADAWATALIVMEPDRAVRLAQELRLDILMIRRNDQGFSEFMTPGFAATVSSETIRGGE